MRLKSNEVIKSIYNKRTEIHYNEMTVPTKNGPMKIELQGKIKCPVLNMNISSITCSKLMDKEDWPRGIDNEVCKKCDCYISLSIKKFQGKAK